MGKILDLTGGMLFPTPIGGKKWWKCQISERNMLVKEQPDLKDHECQISYHGQIVFMFEFSKISQRVKRKFRILSTDKPTADVNTQGQ